MNQLDLILENIRLSHTERLLQEAQTDLELVRGQRLINESVMAIRGALMEEGIVSDYKDARSGGDSMIDSARYAASNGVDALKDRYRNGVDALKDKYSWVKQGFGDAYAPGNAQNPTAEGFATNINAPADYKFGGRLGNMYANASDGLARARDGVVNNAVPLAGGAIGAGLGYALSDEDMLDGYGQEVGAGLGALGGAVGAMGLRKGIAGTQTALNASRGYQKAGQSIGGLKGAMPYFKAGAAGNSGRRF